MNVSISLVIPVYNEQESLKPLYDKIIGVIATLPYSVEIIFVDDGSTDGSVETLLQFQEENPSVITALQRRNFGKSNALLVGFTLASGDYIVTLDADLQDEPAEISCLLEKLDEGYDLVIGWKENRKDSLSKKIPSKIANAVTSYFTGLRLKDMNSGLKAYRSDAAKSLNLYGELHRYIPIMIHMQGYKVAEISVVHHARRFGQSKYGMVRLLRGGFDFVTIVFLSTYGRRPMHLFGLLGLILLFSGLIINIYLTIQWFMGVRPIGDRPLLLLGILLMLVGIQFVTTGLIAEMITGLQQQREDPLKTVKSVHQSTSKTEAI